MTPADEGTYKLVVESINEFRMEINQRLDKIDSDISTWRAESVSHSEMSTVLIAINARIDGLEKASEQDRRGLHKQVDELRTVVDQQRIDLTKNDRFTNRVAGALVFVSVTMPIAVIVAEHFINQ